MKKLPFIILFSLMVLALVKCQKRPEMKICNLEIVDVTIENTTKLEITVKYSYPTKLEYVNVYVSLNSFMSQPIMVTAEVGEDSFKAVMDNLLENTRYYYVFEYSNGVNLVKTEVHDFVTGVYMPIVTTSDVTNITTDSAVCGGEVIYNGVYEVTARGVCWSTSENPTIYDAHTSDSIGTGTFTSELYGLSDNITYYVRAYATNDAGTVYGEQKSFTTIEITAPTVVTQPVTDIHYHSAVCGGVVESDGNGTVTARGVCWSLNENPTTDDSFTSDGEGLGSYTSDLEMLKLNTTYYVRAYATNEKGTAYGEQIVFTTLSIPEGSVRGVYSISLTTQVFFSKGNLQYQASTGTWRFAEHQYDIIGNGNNIISPTNSGWIDLFGWGTGNNPTNVSTDNGDYSVFTDWGNNAISNGGNTQYVWRTLSSDEWIYVFQTRNTESGIRYAKAKVNDVNGVVLLPDNWDSSLYDLYSTNSNSAVFSSNIISSSDWNDIFEEYGAVFLPAAGYRNGTTPNVVNASGYYWSYNEYSFDDALSVFFNNSSLQPSNNNYRRHGRSVRLVTR